jgi:hypothetical protein
MSPRAGYLLVNEVVPRLKSAIPCIVHCAGSEDHQELIQDATAMAARIMHQAEQNGKRVPHSSVVYYAIQHCKSGRRTVGHSSCDVHGTSTQLQGKVRVESMEEVVAIDEITGGEVLLHDVLSIDQEDPGTKAARKMDWETFMDALSEREKAIVVFMIEGKCGSAIARKLKVSDSTVQSNKRHLGSKILEFMGGDILIQIQRKPNWKDDLTATKERMACKYDRCGH